MLKTFPLCVFVGSRLLQHAWQVHVPIFMEDVWKVSFGNPAARTYPKIHHAQRYIVVKVLLGVAR